MDSIAQDIYYKKQTPSCAIFTATLLWNSAGHLLHKTNPELSYFELSYVFWEHNDSVGRGTTVLIQDNIFKKFGTVSFFLGIPKGQKSNTKNVEHTDCAQKQKV